jgi:hypothetical protein
VPAGTGALLEDDMAASNVVDLNCRRGTPKLAAKQNSPGYRGHLESPNRNKALIAD